MRGAHAGATSVLAAQGRSLGLVAVTMLSFGREAHPLMG